MEHGGGMNQPVIPQLNDVHQIKQWWPETTAANNMQSHLQVIIYTAQNLRKELCRRLLENRHRGPHSSRGHHARPTELQFSALGAGVIGCRCT